MRPAEPAEPQKAFSLHGKTGKGTRKNMPGFSGHRVSVMEIELLSVLLME